MTNLSNIAKSLIADVLEDGPLNLDKLREDISESACEAAESACTYTHNCADIIAQYENDSRADADSADDMGSTFTPSQYREAMQCYAHSIARSIIEAEAEVLLDELEDANQHLAHVLALAGLDVGEDAFRLSRDCPHGHAAHNHEDEHGACYWVSGQLDGCNAVAVPAAGVWLSYTWEPASVVA